MVEAAGPVFAGGFESVITTAEGHSYHLLYLPDKHNDDLQRAGKAPAYYWIPEQVRIARMGDTGDFKFRLIHFVGVQTEETTVGVSGTREVAGGVLSVTTTAAPPLAALQASHDQILDRFRGDDRRYWGWRTSVAPQFAPIPVSASKTTLSNLTPNREGAVPADVGALTPTGGVVPTGGTTGGVVPTGGATGAGGPGAPRTMRTGPRDGLEPRSPLTPRLLHSPRSIRYEPSARDGQYLAKRDALPQTGLDAWYWDLQGQGPGSIDPAAENAFSGLLGSLPTAILWQGFRGAYSPISVVQGLQLKVWSENIRIRITGNWDRIFSHFSAAAKGRAWWFSADVKAEFNNLVINGGIRVELEIDGTIPGGDQLREAANKRIDLILNKFMEEANKRIFEPAPPDVKPAEAPDSGGFIGSVFKPYNLGVGLRYRRDQTSLNLEYDETVSERYLMDHYLSSTLEGFYDEIKADPDAERKYFTTLYLDDWDRKVTRIVKPVANWPDPSQRWVGDPVAGLSVQVGYPSASGDIQWVPHIFSGAADEHWDPAFSKKVASDVANAPAGWTPDTTYVKRMVHLNEPPGETDYPNFRAFVEKNVVALDPEPNGTATNDNTIEVRADSVGKLEVGPISLNVALENANQQVEVSFQALGQTDEGRERPITKFLWKFQDQDESRFWEIFTGQPGFVPRYRYQVRVIVRGSLFTKGMEWTGPWVDVGGNGPLVVSVPTPEEAVSTRRLVPGTLAAEAEHPRRVGPPPSGARLARTGAAPALGPPTRTPEMAAAGRSVSGYGTGPTPRVSAPPGAAASRVATEESDQRVTVRSVGTAGEEEEQPLALVSGWTSEEPRSGGAG